MRTQNLVLAEETLIEVFSTPNGSIFQSDIENCVYLHFSNKKVKYKFACLQRLKKVIDKVDIAKMTDVNHSGLEIIFLCGAEDCFVLDIKEILDLKSLLQGAFAMFELNNIIQDKLRRVV